MDKTLWVFTKDLGDNQEEVHVVYASSTQISAFHMAGPHPFHFRKVHAIEHLEWLDNVREELDREYSTS